MDSLETAALKLLDELQLREARLLSWGMVDGHFAGDELEEIAEQLADRLGLSEDPSDLVDWLLDKVLLVETEEGTERFRTRTAEGVRLFARLRQIFPSRGANPGSRWKLSPELVSDFRFVTLPRMYPARSIEVGTALAQLRQTTQITETQRRVAQALLGGPDSSWRLADFQVEATDRILDRVRDRRATGTIVCAGTGSGKTLAFYLPAFMHIVENAGSKPTTQCLAIYPRKELLRDQLQTAISNARTIEVVARERLGRPLSVGVLYGSVPWDSAGLDLPWIKASWPRISARGGKTARRCPYIDCPDCGAPLGWLDEDVKAGTEDLHCSKCSTTVTGQQLRLTRNRASAEPPDILFGTTEMLNKAMSNRAQWKLFGIGSDVRAPSLVLLDEVHTYGGVAGAQVGLTLRRWRHLAAAQPHFVGLSATLADAPRFMAQLVGLYPNQVAAVEPRELVQEGCEHIIALRGRPGTATLSTTIQATMLLRRVLDSDPPIAGKVAGQRVFVFTDNLDVTNRLYFQLGEAEGWARPHPPRRPAPPTSPPLAFLRARGLPDYGARLRDGQSWDVAEAIGHRLHPESRAIVSRTSSQDAGVAGDADIVVATASLEVGFDDPKVGGVVQHQAPRDPAAYVQRKGRAGRSREMRPWTVVVLSDWGRDRQAYRAYEHLFSPNVPPRYLPIGNRHVLRMQAALSFLDWLATQIPFADLWRDLKKPADGSMRARQQAVEAQVTQLLDDPDLRARFAAHLRGSLGLSSDEANALIWEPPRSLLFSVWPTLLRRLERQWGRADGTNDSPSGHPLPEFIPRALFEELNLPEVAVAVAGGRRGGNADDDAEDHWMPIRQALSEFAPGRVSRRFGVSHALDAHWVPPPETFVGELDIETFCPEQNAEPLGTFQYVEDNQVRQVAVFRPHRLRTRQPGRDIHERSDARPIWHTQVRLDGPGTPVILPRGTGWHGFFSQVRFFSHVGGSPAEVRRFTTGANAVIRERTPSGQIHEGQISYSVTRNGRSTPAALGFAGSHDAIVVDLTMPEALHASVAENVELSCAVAGSLFYENLKNDPRLQGIANIFGRAAVAECFVAAAIVLAERGISLREAAERIVSGRETDLLRRVVATLRPEDRAVGLPGNADPDPDAALVDLLTQPTMLDALASASNAFGRMVGPDDESWLRQSLRASVGGLLLGAFQRLCPQVDAGDLLVELSPGPEEDGTVPDNQVWLTEATVGGSGFVESIERALAEDPRRFVHLLEAELEPSDFEQVDHYLRLVLQWITPGEPDYDEELADAFARMRGADTFADKQARFESLRSALRSRGIASTHSVIAAISLRLLRPGSSTDVDRLLLDLVRRHDELSNRVGLAFDDRVYAVLLSFDDAVTSDLRRIFPDLPLDTAVDRHSILTSLLWPRGAAVRRQILAFWNPFVEPVATDRLVLEAVVSHRPHVVSAEDPKWRQKLDEALFIEGRAGLVAPLAKTDLLRDAVLAMASEPIESDSLLLYARVRACKRAVGAATLIFDMPEALQ